MPGPACPRRLFNARGKGPMGRQAFYLRIYAPEAPAPAARSCHNIRMNPTLRVYSVRNIKILVLALVAGFAGGAYAADFGDLAVSAADLKVSAVSEVTAAAPANAELPAAGAAANALYSIESIAKRGTMGDMSALFEFRRELGRKAEDRSMSAAERRELVSRARHLQDDMGVSLLAGGLNSAEPFKGELSVQKAAGFNFPDDLRTGDIMLSRGTNMMGSIAARMSETPGDYSHLGMVYRDPGTREVFILASDSGVGAGVEPLKKFLSGRARLIVMRYNDPELAAKAATLMRAKLENKVPYDYSMNSEDDSSLYCTEVAAAGFKLAGQVKVPLQMSRLPAAGRTRIYSDIGIASQYVFFPQDLEVDPRFEIMAEWTDYSKIGEMNKIDAVYGKMAQWMDKNDYVFTKNILNQGIGAILSTLARKKINESTGGLGGLNIRNGFDYGLTLYQFVTLLRGKMDREIRNKAGYHSLEDLNGVLEGIRAEEYREYKDALLFGNSDNTSSINIHSYFKPGRM